MASDEAHEVSAQLGETSADQPEEYLADQQLMALMEIASTRGTESDCKSRSSDFGDARLALTTLGV
jgi:hypothetical protein